MSSYPYIIITMILNYSSNSNSRNNTFIRSILEYNTKFRCNCKSQRFCRTGNIHSSAGTVSASDAPDTMKNSEEPKSPR